MSEKASFYGADAEAEKYGHDVVRKYVLNGLNLGKSPHRGIRGLAVFGVVQALREHNDALYGEGVTLTKTQQERLDEVEERVDQAVQDRSHWPEYRSPGQGRFAPQTEADDPYRPQSGDSGFPLVRLPGV